MTVREVMECCTSPVWITLDEDSRNGDVIIRIENTADANDILSDQLLDHEVYLMHCNGTALIISLYLLKDVKETSEGGEE